MAFLACLPPLVMQARPDARHVMVYVGWFLIWASLAAAAVGVMCGIRKSNWTVVGALFVDEVAFWLLAALGNIFG